METLTDRRIERENIRNYTHQWLKETDPTKRDLLQKLLAEEIVNQACRGF